MTTHFKIYKQTITVLEKIFCLNKKGEKKKMGLVDGISSVNSIIYYISVHSIILNLDVLSYK